MTKTKFMLAVGACALAGGFLLPAATPASALTMQECSAKYNAAKAGNTLAGQSWNDFRKAQCGDGATAAPAAAAPAAAPANPLKPAAAAPAKPATTAAAPAAAGNVTFPTKIDPKYASEKPARQRMKTCVDQYNANKASGGNGALKWIEKGGGYYSQCNAKMKAVQGV